MKYIKDIKEFIGLAPGTKFYIITDGEVKCYSYCSPHPHNTRKVIALHKDNPEIIDGHLIGGNYWVFLHGRYDESVICPVIIDQLERKIMKVKRKLLNISNRQKA